MKNIIHRIWSNITVTESCWNWNGAKTTAGYGVFNNSGKTEYCHRAIMLASGVSIPVGHYVCHRCDNPSCVRLDHLFVSTPFGNVQDMVAKKRDNFFGDRKWKVRRGEENSFAKLTDNQAAYVRLVGRSKTLKELASKFNVSETTICKIRTGRSWKHV